MVNVQGETKSSVITGAEGGGSGRGEEGVAEAEALKSLVFECSINHCIIKRGITKYY